MNRRLLCPRRSTDGYRIYDKAELEVVDEIRALLAAGFDLDEIRPFVADAIAARPGRGSVA